MKKHMTAAALVITVLAAAPLAVLAKARPVPTREDAAVTVARVWLKSLDAGNYGAGFDQASGLLKKATTKEDFEKALKGSREPLGKLVKRTVGSKKFAKSLPGAPDGEYVVITFNTQFEKKKAAVETVTPMKDKDGKWRVSGYYIK